MTPEHALPGNPRWPAVAALIRASVAYIDPNLDHAARAAGPSPQGLAEAAEVETRIEAYAALTLDEGAALPGLHRQVEHVAVRLHARDRKFVLFRKQLT